MVTKHDIVVVCTLCMSTDKGRDTAQTFIRGNYTVVVGETVTDAEITS